VCTKAHHWALSWAHIPTPYFVKIHFNIILPATFMSRTSHFCSLFCGWADLESTHALLGPSSTAVGMCYCLWELRLETWYQGSLSTHGRCPSSRGTVGRHSFFFLSVCSLARDDCRWHRSTVLVLRPIRFALCGCWRPYCPSTPADHQTCRVVCSNFA
jgi:hypothetical protein